MEKIVLKNTSQTGEIDIGNDCLKTYLPSLTAGQRNFVLTDENVAALHADFFQTYFSDSEIFVMPAGEENKNFFHLQRILERMVQVGLTRKSMLFAVGGGVVGDMGGLCAALYMRGIACTQIPTTLLAQVDSGVGGKTAIDCLGVKNAIGAFYQPSRVLIAPRFLQTLPAREWKCGVGEIVKYAAISAEIFDMLQNNADKLADEAFLRTLIAPCVRYKAEVVERDEKETGERKCLNVGHTTGHALELAFGLSHGESVLYGMLLETEMAVRAGVCERQHAERLQRLVKTALGMQPTSKIVWTADVIKRLTNNALSDKKNGEDGKIVMTVAKAYGEWTTFALDKQAYAKELSGVAYVCD